MEGEQDLVRVRPIGNGSQFFLLMFFSRPPTNASVGFCRLSSPGCMGPINLAGHEASYEGYRPPSSVTQGTWTAFLPTNDGNATWLWEYMGATGLEAGPDAATFLAVLQAFTAPSPPRNTPQPTP